MDTETNKKTAIRFLEVVASHENTEWLEEVMCDDATYWTCGKPQLFAYAGSRGKTDFCAWARTPSIFIDGGAKVSIRGITAEGDRVAIESTTSGTTPEGRHYTNEYHIPVHIPRRAGPASEGIHGYAGRRRVLLPLIFVR